MAGYAKTNSFLLSTATLMIGPTTDLYNLNSNHSVGLVKNLTVTSEPTYTELYQGVKQSMVYSVKTQNPVTISCEVYEYTSKNLTYALGLDGSTLSTQTTYPLAANITGPSTSVAVTSSSNPGWASGNWIMIQENKTDVVHIGRINTYSYTSPTASVTLTSATQVPSGVSFTSASGRAGRMNVIDIGNKVDEPFFSCKIVGILPENSLPVTILIPKVRITRGFTLAFTSDNYGNMPFELAVFDLVPTDPFYNDFPPNQAMAKLFVGT